MEHQWSQLQVHWWTNSILRRLFYILHKITRKFTLQFQIIVPSRLINFWIFCQIPNPIFYLDPFAHLLVFQILFCRYFRDLVIVSKFSRFHCYRIRRTFCSIFTILISLLEMYKFWLTNNASFNAHIRVLILCVFLYYLFPVSVKYLLVL